MVFKLRKIYFLYNFYLVDFLFFLLTVILCNTINTFMQVLTMTAVDLRLLANIIGGLLDMAIESVQVKYAPDKFEQAKILFVKLNNKMFSKNDQYANEFLDFYLQNVERIAELQSAVKK